MLTIMRGASDDGNDDQCGRVVGIGVAGIMTAEGTLPGIGGTAIGAGWVAGDGTVGVMGTAGIETAAAGGVIGGIAGTAEGAAGGTADGSAGTLVVAPTAAGGAATTAGLAYWWFTIRSSTTASRMKTPNTTLVAHVSTSPVLAPNAVDPPRPAERAAQAAPAALLDQDQQDQQHRHGQQQGQDGVEGDVHVGRLSGPGGGTGGGGVDDGEERVGLEGGPADQAAVDVAHVQQAGGVLSGFMLPPYWMRTASANVCPHRLAITPRM